MIAEGIILAYKDLKIQLPVVVRLRGTNEEEGQRMVCHRWFSNVCVFFPGAAFEGDRVKNETN